VAYAHWAYHINRLILTPLIGSCLALTEQDFHFVSIAAKRMSEREKQGGNTKDLLGQMRATQQVKPHFLDSHILHMISTNVLAGSDTTSTALRATIWLLLKHPEALARLRAELREKGAEDPSGENKGVWKFARSEQCPYLQAVLYESLRLFPPAAVTLDRVVPAGGMKAGQYHVPAGVGSYQLFVAKLILL
jgi:cytochrome P450